MSKKVYTRNEVYNATLEYFKGDTAATNVFIDKYALSNNSEYYELTPYDMHIRLAKEFSRIEQKYENPLSYEEILEALSTCKVVPQGSPASGVGNPFRIQSLSNCFVVPSPHDSYGGILHTDEQLAQIMKRRGGAGTDISTIRPKGMPTTNAAKTTDGIAGFMSRYSNTTREVAQGGRRGALLMSLHCLHPQIDTFINIKKNLNSVNGANLSIKWTDQFLNAVVENKEIELKWPVDAKDEDVQFRRTVNANDIFNEFAIANWEADEPGSFFWDTVIRKSIPDCYKDFGFETISSNPCGELILASYASCILFCVNTSKFVKNKWTSEAYFDSNEFQKYSYIAERLLDDLVDLELEAISKIIEKVESDSEPDEIKLNELTLWKKIKEKLTLSRRTGLGLTALGDTIAMLGHRYGDDKSIEDTDLIYKNLAIGAWKSSCIMAKERGAFPLYNEELEKNHEYRNSILSLDKELEELHRKYGRRNIALTTTAPVGSTSMLTQTTSGIEPALYTHYERKVKLNSDTEKNLSVDSIDELGDKWHVYQCTHHSFKDWAISTGHDIKDVEKSPYNGALVEDIDVLSSIKIQAAAQKYVDHSISKTINFPNSATVEQIKEAYLTAWKLGCKGITVFRVGTRPGVFTSTSDKDKTEKSINDGSEVKVNTTSAIKRPKILPCDIHQVKINGEQWTILVGLHDNKPYEIFGGLSKHVEIPKKYKKGLLTKNGKKDGLALYDLTIQFGTEEDDVLVFKNIVDLFENPRHGAWTRLLSLSLRHSIDISYIVEQLQKDKFSDMQSFSRVIARVIKNYIPDGTESLEKCQNCGGKLVYIEKCQKCIDCGNSKCG